MSQTCRRCPFGSTSAKGSTSCELCPAGSFVDSTHDSYSYGDCTVCPEGTYNDKPGYTGASCKLCPAGFTARDEGATECELCPAGSYVDVVPTTTDDVAYCYQCPENSYTTQPGTIGGCEPCPSGYWAEGGATECTQCPPGTYGSGSCMKCPPATYQDEAGAEECKPCPPGFTTQPGAKNLTQCKICPAGSYVEDDSGNDTPGTAGGCKACPPRTAAPEGSRSVGHCRLCPPGRYFIAGADGEPTGQCIPCPANFSSAEGLVADTCEPCPVGTTSGEGATECTPCPAGSYVQEGVVLPGDPYNSYGTRCVACDEGFYSTEPESLECTPCPLGSSTDGPGSTACIPCADDTSGSEILGAPTCELCDPLSAAGAFTCPAGSGRRTGCTAADKCEACPAGTIGGPSPDFGRDACVPCPIGSIAAMANLTTCTPCDAGSSTDRIGASGCTACKPGYFAAQAGDACSPCPPGTFASANGSASCTPCAAGTTHFLKARTTQEECAVAHVPGTNITVTETFVDRYFTAQTNGGSSTTKYLVSTAPVRTVTLVTGGDPVAAPPGYTQLVTTISDGINTSPPETSEYDPPHPTFALRYSLFQLATANAVGGTGSDDFVLLLEHSDGGFKVCGTRRGADGTVNVSCERLIQSGGSSSVSFRQTETLTLTSMAGV
ncbi:hypothetical protein HYH03_005697 [Edaphochlamys debaryana]|uniref:TNFR-Cys domain-containing protein n=1 Tax=Edaphochlamys debaryana TaxID=47281 RepID=A0A835Y6L6_9CHLO|nr:hypothetical protein HYH03_005697 [Edaphochlamys debaryana]|eukprot:KAG2496094.1 hypothetical protein HYH03_005697 [Edaphochlamys debaryana]